MIIVSIIAAIALLLIASLWIGVRGARRRPASWQDLQQRLLPVDVEAFRNLVDPRQEQFLRARLARRQFRTVQHARRRATIDYLHRVSHNAAVLVQAGEAARTSSDPVVMQAGADLVSTAIATRLYALAALAGLYTGVIFPFVPLSCRSVLEIYEKLSTGSLRINPGLR
jgi:hypothetical protein